MDDLLKFIPEEKQEEFKEAAKGYVKLTDDLALKHVQDSQSLRDKVATPFVEAYQRNFKENKLPDILKEEREKLIAELNPKETPKDKELRELKEWRIKQELKEKDNVLKTSLMSLGKEIGYDPIRAADFSIYGDEAEAKLKETATYIKETIQKKIEEEINTRLAGRPPTGGDKNIKIPEDYKDCKTQEERIAWFKNQRLKQ